MAEKKKTKNEKVKLFKREPGWEKLRKGEEEILEGYCADYIDFLSSTKTERRVHAQLVELARKRGFRDIDEVNRSGKKLKPGDGVYRAIDGKTLLLARIGKAPLAEGLNLVGGHAVSTLPGRGTRPPRHPLLRRHQTLPVAHNAAGNLRSHHPQGRSQA